MQRFPSCEETALGVVRMPTETGASQLSRNHGEPIVSPVGTQQTFIMSQMKGGDALSPNTVDIEHILANHQQQILAYQKSKKEMGS